LSDINLWIALPATYLLPFLYFRYRYNAHESVRIIGAIVLGVPWLYALATFFYIGQSIEHFPENHNFWPTLGLVVLWGVLSFAGMVVGLNTDESPR